MTASNAPCDGCDLPQGVYTIVYTGGPPQAPLAAAAVAVNPNVLRRYQPKVHADGRIEYEGPVPPPPEGYRREGQCHRPVWLPCVYRIYHAQQTDDGVLHIAAQCMVTEGSQMLTEARCRDCIQRRPIPRLP